MKITFDKADKIWELISLFILLSIGILIIVSLPIIPMIVPIHFNSVGVADGYGSKFSIWIIFAVAILFYAFMTIASIRIEFNVKDERSKKRQKLIAKMLRVVKAFFLLFILALTYVMLEAAKNKSTYKDPYLLAILFGLIFPPTIYYALKIKKEI